MDFTADQFPDAGSKRRYDFGGGGEMLEAVGGGQLVPAPKKPKDNALIPKMNDQQQLLSTENRSSTLQAPIMLLTGHGGEVFCSRFHPGGQTIASAGFDRDIFLWNVFGDCENFAVLKGHSAPILDMHYTPDGETLVTCSADKLVSLWDYETGAKVKKFKGHTSYVNSCCPARRGPELVVSGSDDCTIKLWDRRSKTPQTTFQNTYPVTAVCFDDKGTSV